MCTKCIKKEEIIVGTIEAGVLMATEKKEVNSVTCSHYQADNLRWVSYLTHDKDQSPEGYEILIYEASVDYPGIFEEHCVLYGDKSPGTEIASQSCMILAAYCLGSFNLGDDRKLAVKKFLVELRTFMWGQVQPQMQAKS